MNVQKSVIAVGGVTAATERLQRRQPGIVPAVDHAVGDQLAQLALRGDRVGELEAGELGLARLVAGQRQVLEVPVVQRAVAVELERAQRVGDALDGVALTVRPVVGGVDAPLVAGAVVVLVADAVHHRVAQLHVLVLHVGLGAQHVRAVGQVAGAHAAEDARGSRRHVRSRYGLSTPGLP